MVHIINLAVKDAMRIILDRVMTIGMIVFTVRSSVKRRDLYNIVCEELELSHSLPGFNVPAPCFYTFRRLEQAHTASRLLTTTMRRILTLESSVISEIAWENFRKISPYLKKPAGIVSFSEGLRTQR